MLNTKKIERINELYQKQKAGTLSAEEKIEQENLRQEYIKAIKERVRQSLSQLVKDSDSKSSKKH
ncbi:MAG: DUF896 domain-containing protein [Firmicutes bacterium]|nr:DUF896 domain-containing protein [Bacillota bacterium]